MKVGARKGLYIIIWISLIQGFLSDYLRLGSIKYLNDVLLMMCLLSWMGKNSVYKCVCKKNKIYVYIPLLCFVFTILIGWFLNGMSFSLSLWGLRNYFRFYIFFFLCLNLFDIEDYKKIQNWLVKLFPLHIAIIMFQILIEHLSYDFLGGIFGKYQGCASGLMIYYGLLSMILISKYNEKNISLKKIFVYFFIMLTTSAIAELKAYFLFLVGIIIIYAFLANDKIKGAIIFGVGLIGVIVGLQLLIRYFPYYANFFTVENIIKQLTDKESTYTYRQGLDIGRSSIFYKLPPVVKDWGGEMAKWFGIGLGNGEYSSTFNFLKSDFYNTYSQSNYAFFSLAFLFVETGYLGVIAYLSFFIGMEIVALKGYLRKRNKTNMIITMMPIFCLFLVYYNSSMRSNFAFVVFALLPMVFTEPWAVGKENFK